MFLFCMLISFILQCFENVFCKIYFKENLEKYTKGLCERFLLKGRNSSYNKKCQRRQCLENRPIIASCVQAKRRSEIPSLPCFPSAEKIPVLTALVVRCSTCWSKVSSYMMARLKSNSFVTINFGL